MSRIGRMPVTLPAGVTVDVKENTITVKGPKGTLTQEYDPKITIHGGGQRRSPYESGPRKTTPRRNTVFTERSFTTWSSALPKVSKRAW